MAEPISIQQLKDASEDAITLADFIYKPANVMIPRRLAADINSLQYYLDYMSSYAQHSYETYDEMVANAVNLPNGVSAFVTNDLDTAKNGIYTYNGANFIKGDYQPEKAAKDYVDSKLGGLQVFDDKVRAQDVSTLDGSTQDVKNTEFRNELDALPFDGGVLADTFVTATKNGLGTVARTQREVNSEVISIRDFGALCDDSGSTIATWLVLGSRIYYASLSAIQVDYPHATSLENTIDWVATQAAINYADSIGGGKVNLGAGKPHWSETLTITTGVNLQGDSRQATIAKYTKDSGYAINIIGGYYDKPVQLSDFELFSTQYNSPNDIHAVKVLHPTTGWGITVHAERLKLNSFTGVSWDLYEVFNTRFTDVITTGVKGRSTLLKFNEVSTFANLFSAHNSVFFSSKINIQNLGCASASFYDCTFEDTNLFLNVVALTGYTVLMNFYGCWFEIIEKGIINAKMNEVTLEPVLPLEQVQPLNRLNFSGNYTSASVPLKFVSEAVNGKKAEYFDLFEGYKPSNLEPIFKTYKYSSGLPADVTERTIENTFDLSNIFMPVGTQDDTYYTVKVVITAEGGNQYSALYMTPELFQTPTIIGSVADRYSIGTGTKIVLTAVNENKLTVSASARGATAIKIDVTAVGKLF